MKTSLISSCGSQPHEGLKIRGEMNVPRRRRCTQRGFGRIEERVPAHSVTRVKRSQRNIYYECSGVILRKTKNDVSGVASDIRTATDVYGMEPSKYILTAFRSLSLFLLVYWWEVHAECVVSNQLRSRTSWLFHQQLQHFSFWINASVNDTAPQLITASIKEFSKLFFFLNYITVFIFTSQ